METIKRNIFQETIGKRIAEHGENPRPDEEALAMKAYLASTNGPGARVLDLGSELGKYSSVFGRQLGARYVGIDSSRKMVDAAKMFHPESNFVEMDIMELGHRKNAYDLVWGMHVLSYLPRESMPEALGNIWNVMVPGGSARLTVQNGKGATEILYLGMEKMGIRVCRYERQEFEALLTKAGFKPVAYQMANGSHHFTVTKP
jgi:trans-aconitate methyltransferase